MSFQRSSKTQVLQKKSVSFFGPSDLADGPVSFPTRKKKVLILDWSVDPRARLLPKEEDPQRGQSIEQRSTGVHGLDSARDQVRAQPIEGEARRLLRLAQEDLDASHIRRQRPA
jgi:hypothetical protein